MPKRGFLFIFLSVLFSTIALKLSAGTTQKIETAYDCAVINGVVIDDFTSEGVPLATVRTIPGLKGVVADSEGIFSISMSPTDSLSVIVSGYLPITLSYETVKNIEGKIRLKPNSRQLNEVTVNAGRVKYTKKNNPAYELMKRAREDAGKANPADTAFYSYDYYNKLDIGLNNVNPPTKGKMAFLSQYADTARFSKLPVLLLSVKEKNGTVIHSGTAAKHKNIIKGVRSNGIDQAFDQENIRKFLEDVLRDVDIFKNNVTILQNRFLSPLGNLADNLYHYYIVDTLTNRKGEKLIELSFTPVNYESFGFNGRMWIGERNSVTYVDSLFMRIPKATNINYVKSLSISQKFDTDSVGKRHKLSDEMSLELQLIPGTPTFYGHRLSTFTNFNNKRRLDLEEFYNTLGNEFMLGDVNSKKSEYWDKIRLVPLTVAENNMSSMLGKLRKMPWFFWGEKVLSVLVQGYWEPKPNFPFAFGPVNTLISYNDIEGVRLRLGGLTTAELSPNIFGRGYVAYGVRDEKWKYNAELEYSFFKKKKHAKEFPINSIRIAHKYDVDFLGQHYNYTNPDNVFLSLKREGKYPATYKRTSQIKYRREYPNNFSFSLEFNHDILYNSRYISFKNQFGDIFPHLIQTSATMKLRWAPGEKFIQGKTYRLPVNMDAPVINLSHTYGPKNFLGSSYTVNHSDISLFKRFWFSAFGYADVTLSGGWIWSKVPFPALLWQNANLSYTIQPESYSLMNPMEFAMDKYASLDFTYWANGALFNFIPGLKKLKLREVVTFKGLMGGLSSRNNPDLNPSMPQYPMGTHPLVLTSTPYMEAGVGIDNILTFLRVDYVWRLTYRHNPNIDRSGLRISLHFTF